MPEQQKWWGGSGALASLNLTRIPLHAILGHATPSLSCTCECECIPIVAIWIGSSCVTLIVVCEPPHTSQCGRTFASSQMEGECWSRKPGEWCLAMQLNFAETLPNVIQPSPFKLLLKNTFFQLRFPTFPRVHNFKLFFSWIPCDKLIFFDPPY